MRPAAIAFRRTARPGLSLFWPGCHHCATAASAKSRTGRWPTAAGRRAHRDGGHTGTAGTPGRQAHRGGGHTGAAGAGGILPHMAFHTAKRAGEPLGSPALLLCFGGKADAGCAFWRRVGGAGKHFPASPHAAGRRIVAWSVTGCTVILPQPDRAAALTQPPAKGRTPYRAAAFSAVRTAKPAVPALYRSTPRRILPRSTVTPA